MRKLKLQMQLSIDGFVATPKGELDWMIWNWDDQLNHYVTKLTSTVDTILLGRILAEGFIPYWQKALENPETASDAKAMVEYPKVVFSQTLVKSVWDNTQIAKGDLVEKITQLKNQKGKDFIAYGGAQFITSLIHENLVDEYHLFINPVVLGEGMTIFKGILSRLNLSLVQSRSFECGIVLLQYNKIN